MREIFFMELLGAFFAGALLFNAIPHLVQGVCGRHHMTPFNVKSSPVVNIIWGWINLISGGMILYLLEDRIWGIAVFLAFGIGSFITSMGLSIFWSNPDARLPWHRK
jgi:hypothetical protein